MSTVVQFRGGTSAQHAAFTGAAREITVDTDTHTVVVHDGATAGGFPLARHDLVKTAFIKADKSTVAFTRTSLATLSIKAGTIVEVNGKLVQFTLDTAVTMPTLTVGTDYAIYVCDDGTVRADANFSAPTGYTSTTARKVGGFHYAPGGNATAQAGGNTIAQINAYSLWDIKFRPAVADPRGMTLVADAFWADIYLLGVNHLIDGTSKYNVTIAKGNTPPKRSTKFGGNGSAVYGLCSWYNFAEVMTHHGKRLPTYNEFQALAYGTTETTSQGGTDTPTTGVNGTNGQRTWNAFTSKWGVIQASGCLWTWGNEFGGPYNVSALYQAYTGGRGSTLNQVGVAVFGGDFTNAGISGSRAANWSYGPSNAFARLGARGVCDHLILE